MAHRTGTIVQNSVHRCNSHDNLYCDTEDDDESSDEDNRLPEVRGCLNKWTNYLHGWQERFFVLKEGALMYYKSPREQAIDCRGALRLSNARITPHGIDECRFDVMVNDSIWYLRTSSVDERSNWLNSLEVHQRAACGQEAGLRVRRNSLISIHSGTTNRSTASSSSVKRTQTLRLKLSEMDTFKEILCRQVDSLQSYFDACSMLAIEGELQLGENENYDTELVDGFGTFEDPDDTLPGETGPQQAPQRSLLNRFLPSVFSGSGRSPPTASPGHDTLVNGEVETEEVKRARHALMQQQRLKDLQATLTQHGAHAIDFKGASCNFKATAAGILTNLGHCIDLMHQREEYWRRRVDKEAERRMRAEEAYRQQLAVTQAVQEKMRLMSGPDCEEGPNCAMLEEEFYDALDAQLDRMEEEEREARNTAKLVAKSQGPREKSLSPEHPLFSIIESTVEEHSQSVDFDTERLINDPSLGWELVVDEGEMRMFTRHVTDENGDNAIPVDPLKAVLTIRGVTAKEVCRYFWDPVYRLEWDHAAEKGPIVLENTAENILIQQQVYRRVWPTVQREAVFWSHLSQQGDLWMVVNRSTDHRAPPLEEGRRVRLQLNVAMVCRTETVGEDDEILESDEDDDFVMGERKKLKCIMQYTAQLHPGGWAPKSIIRSVQRREFPHFLRRFSTHARANVRNLPVDG